GGNKGDDVDDERLVAAMSAFGDAEQLPDAPGQKRFGEEQLTRAGTENKGHDHYGKGRNPGDQRHAHTQGNDAENKRQCFLDAFGNDAGTQGSCDSSKKKGAAVDDRSDHDAS